MRGKDKKEEEKIDEKGITPAYAGKRDSTYFPYYMQGDHPRLCGEKPDTVPDVHSGEGSPPPMRGKGSSDNVLGNDMRITPAYAGKSKFTGISECG